MRQILSLVLLVGALTASAEPARLTMTDGWVRAVPPVADSTAVYFTLVNHTAEPVVVTGARAAFASAAMFHEMVERDGEHQMSHLARLSVPAQGALSLAPGGLHLMLTALDPVPVEGDTVEVCLELSGGEMCEQLPVRR